MQLRENTLPRLRGIIEKSAATNPAAVTDAQRSDAGCSNAGRIGDLYASFMDEARLEQLGITPLRGELAKIAAIKDKSKLPALLARLGKIVSASPPTSASTRTTRIRRSRAGSTPPACRVRRLMSSPANLLT